MPIYYARPTGTQGAPEAYLAETAEEAATECAAATGQPAGWPMEIWTDSDFAATAPLTVRAGNP